MSTLPFVLVLGYVLVEFGRPHNWVPILGYLRPGVIVLGGGILAMLVKRPRSRHWASGCSRFLD